MVLVVVVVAQIRFHGTFCILIDRHHDSSARFRLLDIFTFDHHRAFFGRYSSNFSGIAAELSLPCRLATDRSAAAGRIK